MGKEAKLFPSRFSRYLRLLFRDLKALAEGCKVLENMIQFLREGKRLKFHAEPLAKRANTGYGVQMYLDI